MADESVFVEKYGEVVGRGGMALICGTDEIASKIYLEGCNKVPIFHEAFVMATVERLGLPVPKVYSVELCENRYVLRMTRSKGKNMTSLLASQEQTPEEFMDILVDLQVRMHQIPMDASPLMSKSGILEWEIRYNSQLTDAVKQDLLQGLKEMPEGNSLCHGDFHGGNILVDKDSYVILDWAEATRGPAASDACRTYMDYRYLAKTMGVPEDYCVMRAELYLKKYTASTGMSREEILRWLPFLAAAIYGYFPDEALNRELYAIFMKES